MSTVDLLLQDLGYNTLSTIGEGSYSKVKMATSRKYQCKVAIKVIDKRKIPAEYTMKFLARELDILRKVRHPNVITAFEFIEISNGLHFIVMELCVTDLLQLVQTTGLLPSEKARSLFKQITKAIKYLHEHHVAHRDLKCENILITSDDKAKITDFSFGIMFPNGSNLSTTYCGSAAYASPEVLLSIPYDPRKYDIWSLGVILYIMATGKMPFDETNLNALPKIQQVGVTFPEAIEVDAKCKSLIKEILQYNPNDRPDIFTLIKQEWLLAA
ncbi:testis-specific serine/threonine-protein kinase 6 [Bufo gargarizans]|uniref:testis-specific serine/threonine-protein kinase 6 n=1 Tax=Bufo gargarizans TaxID=30331 RepID=UPI001CF59B8D|nr:testis-specific serine/threonine-protein kinase 6 [Bufo gargarizans]